MSDEMVPLAKCLGIGSPNCWKAGCKRMVGYPFIFVPVGTFSNEEQKGTGPVKMCFSLGELFFILFIIHENYYLCFLKTPRHEKKFFINR